MKLLFHPAALNEMIDAANYYEHQRDGLGGEFDVAIEAAFAAILENPQRWPIVFPNVNRYRLKRFPFGIFYRVGSESITIVAVMHLSRKPGYWIERL